MAGAVMIVAWQFVCRGVGKPIFPEEVIRRRCDLDQESVFVPAIQKIHFSESWVEGASSSATSRELPFIFPGEPPVITPGWQVQLWVQTVGVRPWTILWVRWGKTWMAGKLHRSRRTIPTVTFRGPFDRALGFNREIPGSEPRSALNLLSLE